MSQTRGSTLLEREQESSSRQMESVSSFISSLKKRANTNNTGVTQRDVRAVTEVASKLRENSQISLHEAISVLPRNMTNREAVETFRKKWEDGVLQFKNRHG